MDTLDGLKPRKSAVVIKVAANREFAEKYKYMGIVPGTVVFMLKNSPFKKHVEITLRGYVLRLTKKDAGKIEILKTSSKHRFLPLKFFKIY